MALTKEQKAAKQATKEIGGPDETFRELWSTFEKADMAYVIIDQATGKPIPRTTNDGHIRRKGNGDALYVMGSLQFATVLPAGKHERAKSVLVVKNKEIYAYDHEGMVEIDESGEPVVHPQGKEILRAIERKIQEGRFYGSQEEIAKTISLTEDAKFANAAAQKELAATKAEADRLRQELEEAKAKDSELEAARKRIQELEAAGKAAGKGA